MGQIFSPLLLQDPLTLLFRCGLTLKTPELGTWRILIILTHHSILTTSRTPILRLSKTITDLQLSMPLLLLPRPLLPIWTPTGVRWVPPIKTPTVAPQAPPTPSQARRRSQLRCPQLGRRPHRQRKRRCVSLQRIPRPCRIYMEETHLACILTLGSSTGSLQMMEIGILGLGATIGCCYQYGLNLHNLGITRHISLCVTTLSWIIFVSTCNTYKQ